MTNKLAQGLLEWIEVNDDGSISIPTWYGGIADDLKEALKMAKQALQADGEYINREATIDNITTGLCKDIACAECPFDDANDMCKVREWLKQLPSPWEGVRE